MRLITKKTVLFSLLALSSSVWANNLNVEVVKQQGNRVTTSGFSVENKQNENDFIEKGEYFSVDSGSNIQHCINHFPFRKTPMTFSQQQKSNSIMLCFDNFVTVLSKESKNPLLVGEYISRNRLMVANEANRQYKNKEKHHFHSEVRAPEEYRAMEEYYSDVRLNGSLYQIGQLIEPDHQMNDLNLIKTYSLANAIPINLKLKEGLWKAIFNGVNQYVQTTAEQAFVVSGVAYQGSTYRLGGLNGVAVPQFLFKAFYFPVQGVASVYWMENKDTTKYQVLSVEQLRQRIGVDVFPGVNNEIKLRAVYPPKPIF